MVVLLGRKQAPTHDKLAQAAFAGGDGARQVVAGRMSDAFDQGGQRGRSFVHVGMTLFHVGLNARHAAVSRSRLPSNASATRGRKGLSSSEPDDTASVMAWSLAMTCIAAWVTASGTTGFTLPGMMDEPAWRGGRRISPRPALGPDESRRRSEHTFHKLLA